MTKMSAEVESSPEVPKSVSSIIQKFERIVSVESDSNMTKEKSQHKDSITSESIKSDKKTDVMTSVKVEDIRLSRKDETDHVDIKRDSTRDSLDVSDLEMEPDVSPGTHLKHLVEDIEIKAKNISRTILEERSGFDTKTEKEEHSMLKDEKISPEEKRRSVRELVQRHESLVKESSLERTDSFDKETKRTSLTEKPKQDFIQTYEHGEAPGLDEEIVKSEKLKQQEDVPLMVENREELIMEEENLQELKEEMEISTAVMEESGEWETAETIVLESPSKLPSPLEHEYRVYSTEEPQKVKEETTLIKEEIESVASEDKVRLREGFEDSEATLKTSLNEDDQLHYAKEVNVDQKVQEIEKPELVDISKSGFEKIDYDLHEGSEIEVCQEIEHAEIVESELDKSDVLEIIEPEKKVMLSDIEYQSEEMVECEELEPESIQQFASEEQTKAHKINLPSELDITFTEQEVVSESFDGGEHISPELYITEDKLVSAAVTEPKILSAEAEMSPEFDKFEVYVDLKEASSEVEDEVVVDKLSESKTILEYEIAPNVAEEIEILPKEHLRAVKIVANETEPNTVDNVCHEKGDDEQIIEENIELETKKPTIEELELDSKIPIQKVSPDKSTESPVSDEDLVEKPTHVSRESSFEVHERKIENQELSEHDAYFIKEKQLSRLKKQTVLLSRQESNIEITLDECVDRERDSSTDEESKESKDYHEAKSSDTQEEVKPTEKQIVGDIEKEISKSKVEETKEIITKSFAEEIEECSQVSETHTGLIDSEMESSEPVMVERSLRDRIYTDIMQAADEEMEGEPVGFSVRPRSEDENEYGVNSDVRFELNDIEEVVVGVGDVFYPEIAESTEVRMKSDHTRQDNEIHESTAEVIEIIEGDEDEDTIQKSQSIVSELVELDENEMIKTTTSDYDLALTYTDRLEYIEDVKRKDSTTRQESEEREITRKDTNNISKEDIIEKALKLPDDIVKESNKVESFESSESSETFKSCETEMATPFEVDNEKMMPLNVHEFIDIEDTEKDELVEIDYKYVVDDFDESYIDRTEHFIELGKDDLKIDKLPTGKKDNELNLEEQDNLDSGTQSMAYQVEQEKSLFGKSSLDMQQGVVDDIESDISDDAEVESYVERRSQKSSEPEQLSIKSSERPLSPTDYTLEMDVEEPVAYDDEQDEQKDEEEEIEPEEEEEEEDIEPEDEDREPEGRMSADVSQQIFIEQNIEQQKARGSKMERELGDGLEKAEEVPPSPSEYTLVTSYEQEKLKQILSSPEKRSPHFARVFHEDALSVSMDESVLKRELGIERNVMSASYDEEALKHVYDEEDIMVSSVEHVMQDSLIASSLEPDELRVTGSVGSCHDSVSSSEHKSGAMTDSYDQDSLQKSAGSARESSMADSMEPDMLHRALGREEDLMSASMDQDALQRSLGFESDLSSSMDQDMLKKTYGFVQGEVVMSDSIERDQMTKSLDVVKEEMPLTSSLDDEIMEKALGFGRASVMETSADQDRLRVSIGVDKTADLLTTSLEFDDLDALHRSLGLAGSESQEQQSNLSELTEKNESQATEISEGMAESFDDESLRKSLDIKSDQMSSSMDQFEFKKSIKEDTMSASMDPDALRASLGLDRIESSDEDSFEMRLRKSKELDPMMVSMDQDALQASLELDEKLESEGDIFLSRDKKRDIMMDSMEPDALRASLVLDETAKGDDVAEQEQDEVTTPLHAPADDTAPDDTASITSSEQAAVLQTPDQSESNTASGFSNDFLESEIPPPMPMQLEVLAAQERKKMVSSYENVYTGVPLEPTVNRMSMDASELEIGDRFDTKQPDSKLQSGLSSSYEKLYDKTEDQFDEEAQKKGPQFIDPQYGDSEEDEVVEYQDDEEDLGAEGGDLQSTRITMKKEIHTTTVLKDGQEQTFVDEDSKVETDPNAPEELRESMQQIINEFMGSPTDPQKSLEHDF